MADQLKFQINGLKIYLHTESRLSAAIILNQDQKPKLYLLPEETANWEWMV